MEQTDPHCDALTSPDLVNFGVSIFILVGILVSYLLQHYRIISRRSSEGISPYFILLGTTSGTSALTNILAQPASWEDFQCCRQISGFQCFSAVLGVVQVGLLWACFAVILLLWLLFFPRASALSPPHALASHPSYNNARVITSICVLHMLLLAVITTVMVQRYPANLQSYADILGVIAALLACVQYLPQLYTTWRLKTVGSLSLPMMCLQTPGSFVWAASLGVRLGWAGWSTWGLFVATGMLQGSVLALGLWFEWNAWRKRKALENGPQLERNIRGEETDVSDEITPLIGHEH